MFRNMTRRTAIQVWFAAVALVAVAAVAFGVQMNVGTAGMLVALSLVPPIIAFLLWPGGESLTAGDVIRGTDRRT